VNEATNRGWETRDAPAGVPPTPLRAADQPVDDPSVLRDASTARLAPGLRPAAATPLETAA
jgi:hypothetical protein